MGGGQIMMMAPPWTLGYAALIFLMWAIMMVAMMLPSAAPTILLVSSVGQGPTLRRWRFHSACGYVLVWTGFSLAATALQFGLDRAGAPVRDNGHEQRGGCWDRADCRGCLSMDPIEASLPAALPLATGVPATPMASRRMGSGHERYAAWSLLPRLLLDADGPAFRWRIDEHIVDCRACPAVLIEKDAPLGRPHKPCDRRRTVRMGSCHACQHLGDPSAITAARCARIPRRAAVARSCPSRETRP